MNPEPIPAGKLPTALLSRLLATLGPMPVEVRVGPAVGEDACVLDVAAGLLVVATDPITLTTSDVGRYVVIINANDVAVCGARPRWFLATVLLPLGTTAELVETVFAMMRKALDEVGAVLVGGHTEVTSAVNQPVIVGQMIGVTEGGHFVTTAGAAPGDIVVQVGPVPIEGAAVLAAEAADRLTELPAQVINEAKHATSDPGISVVDAALAAGDLGATAMHDPTEGGLAAGLHELAVAARSAIRVDGEQVCWFEPGLRVCRALGADPWATLASGSLLATFPPHVVDEAVELLGSRGHTVAPIGVVEPGTGVFDTNGRAIAWPVRDEVARLILGGARRSFRNESGE
jgi:hydrogenase maturation factor